MSQQLLKYHLKETKTMMLNIHAKIFDKMPYNSTKNICGKYRQLMLT